MSHHTYQPTAQDEQDEEQVAADLELDWYPPPASTFWDSAAAGETARYTQPLSGRDTRDRASYHSSESAATAVNGELDQYYHGEDAKLKDGEGWSQTYQRDPFSDGTVSTPTEQRPPTRFGAYTPFVPPPSEGRFLATAAQQTHARPQVSHSTGSYSSLYASSHNTGYTRASAYSNAQSRAASPFDHFAHDAEAYASGAASRAAWQPPRSRSPTPAPDAPAVDEDEYLITSSGAVMNPANLSVDDGMPGSFSPRKSPARKDAAAQQKSKPKWIPTILPPGLPLHGRSQVPGSIRSGHSGDAPSFDARSIPASPLPTRHFGPAPSGRAQRRNKGVTKRVQLTNGNLILELAVPPKMVLPFKREPEMATTRYTAVHGDPNHFERNGFSLRQNLFNRTTELLIVLTMFNEDEVLFCRTLHGVMQNISHLCSRKNSRTWGPDSWKKVVVCIVADGRKKIHPSVLDCLTLLGVYQPGGHMKNKIDDHEVTAHVFEYTTTFGLDPNIQYCYPDKGIVPTQILFCLKEKNQRKINSHRWAFRAFAPLLQPNVCVLLDVGTMPGPKSIYHLWKTFDLNSNVGGACGEIAVYKGKRWSGMLNPLVASQDFEYKLSNILDKTTESMCGYISVLPGAFSAYRYIALQNDERDVGPLASYFKGEILHGRDTDIFTSNMYLAEDRILCFELVAKANSAWVLKYVNRAIAHTDVPEALPEFIGQRRRWLNGSFFAATYAIVHAGQILRSGHSIPRKFVLALQVVYNVVNLTFSWFNVGNFYLFFVIMTSSLENGSFGLRGIQYWNFLAQYLLAMLVVACFILSMGNKPSAARWKYKTVSIALSLLMVYLCGAAIITLVRGAMVGGPEFRVMAFGAVITYGVYVGSSILALDPWHILLSFIPYVLLSPTYFNVLNIYAFANLDDISWGTKGETAVSDDLGTVKQNALAQVDVEVLAEPADIDAVYADSLKSLRARKFDSLPKPEPAMRTLAERESDAKDYYASVRTNVLLAWVVSNGLLLVFILGGGVQANVLEQEANMSRTKAYLTFVLCFVALLNIIRFLGSTMYLTIRLFTGA